MKAKKAVKRINRAEALLTSVLHEYAGKHRRLRDFLNAAKASLGNAKKAIGITESSPASTSAPAKAAPVTKGRAAPRRKASAAAAKTRSSPKKVARRRAVAESTPKTSRTSRKKATSVLRTPVVRKTPSAPASAERDISPNTGLETQVEQRAASSRAADTSEPR